MASFPFRSLMISNLLPESKLWPQEGMIRAGLQPGTQWRQRDGTCCDQHWPHPLPHFLKVNSNISCWCQQHKRLVCEGRVWREETAWLHPVLTTLLPTQAFCGFDPWLGGTKIPYGWKKREREREKRDRIKSSWLNGALALWNCIGCCISFSEPYCSFSWVVNQGIASTEWKAPAHSASSFRNAMCHLVSDITLLTRYIYPAYTCVKWKEIWL